MDIALIFYGVILLVVFLLPLIDGVHNAGTFVGTVFGAVTLIIGLNFEKLEMRERGIALFVIAGITLVAFFLMFSVYNRGKSRMSDAKTVIVLGCRVRGLEPSKALCKRVDRAFTILSGDPEKVAILSGGQGSDELISEAECMRRMLVERGIAEDRLYLENRSTSTDENIRFSVKILKENDLSNRVILVTSEYHQFRALWLCEKYGLEAAPQSSKTKALHLPTFLIREIMGIVKDRIL